MAHRRRARAGDAGAGSLYPTLDVGVNASRLGVSRGRRIADSVSFPATSNDFRIGLNASYELDLWGKYRAATRAAQNDVLATRVSRARRCALSWRRKSRAHISACSQPMRSCGCCSDTLTLRNETVALQTDRQQAGVIGDYDLAQAKAERAAVTADIAITRARDRANSNRRSPRCTGRSPRDVFDAHRRAQRVAWPAARRSHGAGGTAVRHPRATPGCAADRAGSSPRASLRIDRARADYFPSVSLTGALGSESAALSESVHRASRLLVTGRGPLAAACSASTRSTPTCRRLPPGASSSSSTIGKPCRRRSRTCTMRSPRTGRRARRSAAETERSANLQQAYDLAGRPLQGSAIRRISEVLDAQRQLLQAQTLQILSRATCGLRSSTSPRRWVAGGSTRRRSGVRAAAAAAK